MTENQIAYAETSTWKERSSNLLHSLKSGGEVLRLFEFFSIDEYYTVNDISQTGEAA